MGSDTNHEKQSSKNTILSKNSSNFQSIRVNHLQKCKTLAAKMQDVDLCSYGNETSAIFTIYIRHYFDLLF